MGNVETAECAYGAADCPKTSTLHEDLDNVNLTLTKLSRIVYILAGIISVEFGYMII